MLQPSRQVHWFESAAVWRVTVKVTLIYKMQLVAFAVALLLTHKARHGSVYMKSLKCCDVTDCQLCVSSVHDCCNRLWSTVTVR